MQINNQDIERRKQIENFDLVKVLLHRYKCNETYTIKNDDEVIAIYESFPKSIKISINNLVKKVYFKNTIISERSIYKIVSTKSYIENIMRIIVCQNEYIKANNIDITIDEKDQKTSNIDERSVVISPCWNCNSTHKKLKTSKSIVFCFSCGKYYYDGKEISPSENIGKQRIRS